MLIVKSGIRNYNSLLLISGSNALRTMIDGIDLFNTGPQGQNISSAGYHSGAITISWQDIASLRQILGAVIFFDLKINAHRFISVWKEKLKWSFKRGSGQQYMGHLNASRLKLHVSNVYRKGFQRVIWYARYRYFILQINASTMAYVFCRLHNDKYTLFWVFIFVIFRAAQYATEHFSLHFIRFYMPFFSNV